MDQRKHIRRGATMVELVGTLAIIGLMMSIVAPIFLSAMSDAKAKGCREDMQAVANAEEQYRMLSSSHAYTTNLSDLKSVNVAIPKCAQGGTYSITISDGTAKAQNGQTVPAGQIVISCSISGHGKFAPDIDNN